MKYYNSYFDRQELSSAAHETLLHLEARKKASSPVWMPIGALAACTALIVAAGVWKLSPAPAPAPAQSGSQITLDNVPTAEDQPLQTDVSQPGDWETSFVVSNSGMKGKLAFPMIPGIEYPDQTESPDMALSRAYMPGAFTVDLAKEDIQTIFWGPEGKPQADHPKTEQGDLPWMLFWDGYTLQGRALYDGQGQLTDGSYTESRQALGAASAHHKQIGDRERPHFCGNLVGIESVYLSRFFKIACHLGQDLDIGDSHIDRKGQLLKNPIPDLFGCRLRGGIPMGDGGEIQIAFVYGNLFQIRCKFQEQFHHGLAAAAVQGMIGGLYHQSGAFAQGGGHRLPGLDFIFFGRQGFCQYYPAAVLLVPADDGGNSPQIYRTSVFQFFQGAPA